MHMRREGGEITCPLKGIEARILSNALCRSVVTSTR